MDGTLNVLLAAVAAGSARVVLASSSSVYGDAGSLPRGDPRRVPLSPYAVPSSPARGCARASGVGADRVPALLQRVRAAPGRVLAVRRGRAPIHVGDRLRGAGRRFTVTASRRGTSPTSTTWWRQPAGRQCRPASWQRAQRGRRVPRHSERHRRRRGPGAGTAGAALACAGARPGGRALVGRHGPCPALAGYAPGVGREEGLRRTAAEFLPAPAAVRGLSPGATPVRVAAVSGELPWSPSLQVRVAGPAPALEAHGVALSVLTLADAVRCSPLRGGRAGPEGPAGHRRSPPAAPGHRPYAGRLRHVPGAPGATRRPACRWSARRRAGGAWSTT